jgi:hypothetical protein
VEKLCGRRGHKELRGAHALVSIPFAGDGTEGNEMPVSTLRNGKMIIKVSDVKEVVGDRFRISEEFYCELDREVHEMIERAARRAKKNGRKTLKPYDL